MREFLRNLSICFTAGAVGGLIYALALWAMGSYGLSYRLGVDIAPYLSNSYLYQRVVWGGICGLVLLLPFQRAWFSRGLILSLIPAAVLLLVVLPMRGYGPGGLGLGTLTPLVVWMACAAGGVIASGLLRAQGK
ncbi:hypothetical protein [Microbulbifer guangxiensis]|uniref:hypothetical protein n=1 Tax=Microbulbifer guangxiensis TaxID=2904249 RepID=UPI001F25A0A6|nr:hypothetical protein [Microbulbifer guangxiensis]